MRRFCAIFAVLATVAAVSVPVAAAHPTQTVVGPSQGAKAHVASGVCNLWAHLTRPANNILHSGGGLTCTGDYNTGPVQLEVCLQRYFGGSDWENVGACRYYYGSGQLWGSFDTQCYDYFGYYYRTWAWDWAPEMVPTTVVSTSGWNFCLA